MIYEKSVELGTNESRGCISIYAGYNFGTLEKLARSVMFLTFWPHVASFERARIFKRRTCILH